MKRPNSSLAEVLRAAGIPDASGALWETKWEQSGATFPTARQEYLNPDWITQIADELAWPAEVRNALIDGLDLFRACPELRRLLWHCRHLLFIAPDEAMDVALKKWPAMSTGRHPAADLFYAYVFLSGLPAALELHRRRNLPMEVPRATFADFPLWLEDFRCKHGRWGLSELQGTGWLYSHLRGRLYQLGRLQFRFETYQHPWRAYRNRTNGRMVLLAESGQVLRPDGRYDGANGIHAGADAWTTNLHTADGVIVGFPADPRGFAKRTLVKLPVDEWSVVLARDENVLGIHIPAGAPLTPESCSDSMRSAMEFFPKYFPEYTYKAFTSTTWMFDSQLADYLPHESNLIQFQRQFYLYPILGACDRQIMERVFGKVAADPADMPRATSLQRIVADHMLAGGRWYKTGGCFFADDMPRWGMAPYLVMG
ncbi:MAG: acyltransferase domain-containing protein [Kiritimatiellia bacterium]|jgi:hypothetical protein